MNLLRKIPDEFREILFETIMRLDQIMRECDGYGYDTYDTRIGKLYLYLSQKRSKRTFADLLLKGLYALELAAPIYYRKIRGIHRTWDPMGNSYRAGVHLTLYQACKNTKHLLEARSILDRIQKCAVGKQQSRGFALGFPCITGSNVVWKTNVPVAHYSIRVARKFLIYERIARDNRYRTTIEEVVTFLTNDLPWVNIEGRIGVGYTPEDPLQVINIWADTASFLSCYSSFYGNKSTYRDKIFGLVENILNHQKADGGWPYFASWEGKPQNEDNSHTAMVLGALADISICYSSELKTRLIPVLEKGVERWVATFFEEETGRHWNTVDRTSHSYTVCLGDTLYAILRLVRPELGLTESLVDRLQKLADKVVVWSIQNLRRKSGRFCERRLPYRNYSVQSIRSFDGLVCDSLALYWAQRYENNKTNNFLWCV
jgi:hypothetical protein